LRSHHGRYLCAEPNGKVIADRNDPREWEHFTVTSLGGGKIALLSHHNQYLCVEKDLKTIVANRSAAREWETLTPVHIGGSGWALQTYWGTYLCAETNYTVNGDRRVAKEWETWQIK